MNYFECMPNHITTKISWEYMETEFDQKTIASEKMAIDFEKIVPSPKNMFHGELGKKEIEDCEERGIPTWYDWCPKNWGTKWNAYSIEFDGYNDISFQTAWDHPKPVIKKLSELNPTITFSIVYASEDQGLNLGAYTIKNGKVHFDAHIEDMDEKTRELFAQAVYNIKSE